MIEFTVEPRGCTHPYHKRAVVAEYKPFGSTVTKHLVPRLKQIEQLKTSRGKSITKILVWRFENGQRQRIGTNE